MSSSLLKVRYLRAVKGSHCLLQTFVAEGGDPSALMIQSHVYPLMSAEFTEDHQSQFLFLYHSSLFQNQGKVCKDWTFVKKNSEVNYRYNKNLIVLIWVKKLFPFLN